MPKRSLAATIGLTLAAVLGAALLSAPAASADVGAPVTLGVARVQSGNLVWHLSNDLSGTTSSGVTYGVAGDIPVSGDWDGNGTDTPGVVRQVGSNFVFYLTNDLSGTGATAYHVTYGVPGDIPVVGDWDNDGTDTPGVVRQVGGDLVWYLTNSLSGTGSTWTHVTYGAPGDVPVAGDWDGDGSDTPGVVRSIGGIYQWHVSNNLAGTTSATVAYGQTGDTPVAGDWDGNGSDTPGAVRPSGTAAAWHLTNNFSGTTAATVTYGLASDDPTPGTWVLPVACSVPGSCSPQQFAQAYEAQNYGWGSDQYSCLVSLWNQESGWRYNAINPPGGDPNTAAYGIPQALPGNKMAAYGADWVTNDETQIKWGLGYVSSVYGSPCGAWSHEQTYGWY